MMITLSPQPPGPMPGQSIELERIIALHGPWRVLRAALSALLRPRPRPLRDAAALSGHLRRDLGLPDRPDPPPVHPFRF